MIHKVVMAKKRPVYGVFFGTKWAMTRSKRKAITEAKKHADGQVFKRDHCEDNESWDAPTFRAMSTQIYPFVADILPRAIC